MVNKPPVENLIENIRLGEKIAFFRKRSGISQEILAQRIGKTRSTVAAYENNIADITISILRDIAKALEIHIYDFVHEIDLPQAGRFAGMTTYTQDLENQISLLREDLDGVKKELNEKKQELNDKNKIIALYEKREGDIEKKRSSDRIQASTNGKPLQPPYNKALFSDLIAFISSKHFPISATPSSTNTSRFSFCINLRRTR